MSKSLGTCWRKDFCDISMRPEYKIENKIVENRLSPTVGQSTPFWIWWHTKSHSAQHFAASYHALSQAAPRTCRANCQDPISMCHFRFAKWRFVDHRSSASRPFGLGVFGAAALASQILISLFGPLTACTEGFRHLLGIRSITALNNAHIPVNGSPFSLALFNFWSAVLVSNFSVARNISTWIEWRLVMMFCWPNSACFQSHNCKWKMNHFLVR